MRNGPYDCAVTENTKAVWDGSSAATAVPKRTPIERISSSLSETRDLSERVCAIVDTLIGARPECEGKGLGISVGGGLIPSLADNAEDAAAHIRKAQDELHRLSQVLGLGV